MGSTITLDGLIYVENIILWKHISLAQLYCFATCLDYVLILSNNLENIYKLISH